ncbi:MAG: glutathione peroxidase [Rhodospirillales bacterium]|nr:glutathione peroxidase [Rhodospirillales bacterium]
MTIRTLTILSVLGLLFFPLTLKASPMSFHDFEFTSIDGQPLPAKTFAGKAVLVVNTASECGFTKQYSGLQSLYDKYRDKGLVVLGVPSNDFGGQEPGTEGEIKEFCETNFNIDFPMTSKAKVKGEDAHPFYQWASDQVGMLGSPKWNFHKFLIAPDGTLKDWFATTTAPDAPKLTKAVESVLPK